MALESSDMILYVAKISYQSDNWFRNCWGDQNFTQTHTQTDTNTNKHKHKHKHKHTHTHTPRPFYVFFFKEKRLKSACTYVRALEVIQYFFISTRKSYILTLSVPESTIMDMTFIVLIDVKFL